MKLNTARSTRKAGSREQALLHCPATKLTGSTSTSPCVQEQASDYNRAENRKFMKVWICVYVHVCIYKCRAIH